MQYELMIHCLRTPGLQWLAEWQNTRYVAVAAEAFGNSAEHDPGELAVDINELSRFVVAALDGLVIQYVACHDAEQSQQDTPNPIGAAIAMARLEPGDSAAVLCRRGLLPGPTSSAARWTSLADVRRPATPSESPTLGFTRRQFEATLTPSREWRARV